MNDILGLHLLIPASSMKNLKFFLAYLSIFGFED
jgi:hypothetical protein